MRLRQFVIVAETLSPAVDDLCAVLDLEVCYRDPGVAEFGIENALMPLGGDFLEVIAPTQPGTAAGRFLDRRGPGGYMLIFECGNALDHRQRLGNLGVRPVWRHDAADAVATHFHPQDWPGAIVSIDTMLPVGDWLAPLAAWKWAGPDWRRHVKTGVAKAITGVEIEAPDAGALATLWAILLDRPPAAANAVAIDNASISFVPAPDETGVGITGLRLSAADAAAALRNAEERGLPAGDSQIAMCGLRIDLR